MSTGSSIDNLTAFDFAKARELIRAIKRPEPRGLKWKVAQLKEDLLEARKDGVTYAQLHEALAKGGIEISLSTLRQYLGEAKRTADAQSKSARGKAGRAHTESGSVAAATGTTPVLEELAEEGAAKIEPASVAMHAEESPVETIVEPEVDTVPEVAASPPAP